MPDPVPVLQFANALLKPGDQPPLSGVTFSLEPGACAVIHAVRPADLKGEGYDSLPLADAAQGLLPCGKGEVRFLGRDWADLQPLEQARMRGRIGRLFDFHAWVYNLSVRENLILARLAHPPRDFRAADAEALALARRFGLDAVPEGRPVLYRKWELRIFEWIRAFMGKPALLVLERPEMDLPTGALDTCFELAAEAAAAGTALLWITHDNEMVRRILRIGAATYAVQGRSWLRREESNV